MSQATIQHVQKQSNSLKSIIPPIATGNRVRVHQKIMETTKDGMKERIQTFEGLVIALNSGSGTDKTFTVRKISYGVGVEKIFPLHSKNIAKVEILGHSKVGRAKLYFMRERTGKSARLKEATLKLEVMNGQAQEVTDELIEEAVEAAKKAEDLHEEKAALEQEVKEEVKTEEDRDKE
ncbi:MAG: 50S ribosomal protein L19, large subunit ribosomal protein L19 [Candidatus Peregrinibacteria bacterium GW2011_GWE2_39_6]|nr:MAG: 50S ribosomal protein L19, large subunit ribosomal protein L19 [Candidatus Peregrinibacteria bacterium GW2011_GWF2_39_17]KKR26802.1 MAG: 50S ribosomal protein L19, large subunit ribosomal protein L19 [Candidatus Peregrinibacteria bacterium GW2011_GWE2_39_6]HCW32873.1 50S ribosomal protein L19 [Candidatus Peregrinibacteria bacterium]